MTLACDHPDYPPLPPSARHRAADALYLHLREHGLATADGPRRDASGKFWELMLLPNDVGSGKVRVYGASYVYVALFVRLMGSPEKIDRVYGSAEEAAAYVTLLLGDRDVEAAEGVPQRPAAREKNRV